MGRPNASLLRDEHLRLRHALRLQHLRLQNLHRSVGRNGTRFGVLRLERDHRLHRRRHLGDNGGRRRGRDLSVLRETRTLGDVADADDAADEDADRNNAAEDHNEEDYSRIVLGGVASRRWKRGS